MNLTSLSHEQAQKSPTQRAAQAKAALLSIAAAIAVSACARFSTVQVDDRYEDGKLAGRISTKVKSHTFFSSKSQLANFKAAQTEKSQGATVGTLSMQGATNTTGAISETTELLRELNRLKSPIP